MVLFHCQPRYLNYVQEINMLIRLKLFLKKKVLKTRLQFSFCTCIYIYIKFILVLHCFSNFCIIYIIRLRGKQFDSVTHLTWCYINNFKSSMCFFFSFFFCLQKKKKKKTAYVFFLRNKNSICSVAFFANNFIMVFWLRLGKLI